MLEIAMLKVDRIGSDPKNQVCSKMEHTSDAGEKYQDVC